MSSSTRNNDNLPFDLSNHSNPRIREMATRHNALWGSTQAVGYALYGSSSTNSTNSGSRSPSDSKTANSNGIYMVHCYYGCQPGNKVTTVIG